jgi:adenylate cyclase
VIEPGERTLDDISRCFGGAIPAVLGTASAEGLPNVTYLSRALQVDAERIALSNQFMSKTARNVAANPRASLLLLDPLTHDEYRLTLVFERTERRGHVFERLRDDIDALAALVGMQDIFRLRAADIYRVVEIEQFSPNPAGQLPDDIHHRRASSPEIGGIAALAACASRAGDLDVLVETALDILDRELGYRHTTFLLLDETGQRLFTIASRGFDTQGIGAEVAVGKGQIGMVAARCQPLRTGALVQSQKYAGAIRRRYEETGVGPGREVPLPGVAGVQSRIAVPAMAIGQLVGVLVAESRDPVAFSEVDEQILVTAAALVAGSTLAIAALESSDEADGRERAPAHRTAAPASSGPELEVRYFIVDGSVFVDRDYVIKGVAGRILWSLLRQYAADGRCDFTNRELRLEPDLQLPGFRDNLESRLILLKRRLDERQLPLRIEKSGRGRFRLVTEATFALEEVGA